MHIYQIIYEIEQKFEWIAREIAEEYDLPEDYYGDYFPDEYTSLRFNCIKERCVSEEAEREAREIMRNCAESYKEMDYE